MNTREIEQLIEKYFEGATSLEEEQALREFFRSADVPPHLAPHRPLFAFAEQELLGSIEDPEFDRKLEARLDGSKVIPLRPASTRWYYMAGVAAVVVLLIGIAITYLFNFKGTPDYSDHNRLAYAQAREAIIMVSSGLNKGIDPALRLGAFDKGMEKAQMLSRFYEYQTLIINPDELENPSRKTK